MGVFDLSATYDLSSDVPQTYETRTEDFVRVLRAPVRDLSAKQSLGNGQSPVLWIATFVLFCLLEGLMALTSCMKKKETVTRRLGVTTTLKSS